jgi:hypothetical protein
MVGSDAQARLIELVRDVTSQETKSLAETYGLLPAPEYCIPMTFRYAVQFSNEVADRGPTATGALSAAFGTSFRVLLTIATKCLDGRKGAFLGPYFDAAQVIDPMVKQCFDIEFHLIFLREMMSSITQGYWKISEHDGIFRIGLDPRIRRSALNLLAAKCEYLSYPNELQRLFKKKRNLSRVKLALLCGIRDIDPVRLGAPDAWRVLMEQLSFSNVDLESFFGFLAYLTELPQLWYAHVDFFEAWIEYLRRFKRPPFRKERLFQFIEFFAMSPDEALSAGVPVCFVKFGEWYAHWPFFDHILHPNLSFLALVMRKREKLWSETIGSEMAKVASHLKSLVPKFPDLLVGALRSKAGIGDADLAIYNTRSQHLFLCEIKTVFDRFRTNYQRTNFVEQKVNFTKANAQLRKIESAIQSGEWKLSEMFLESPSGLPRDITCVVLTWWDVANANAGTVDADILSCNFKTFLYLLTKAQGDLGELRDSLVQLSTVFCVASVEKGSIKSELGSFEYLREIQTEGCPPLSQLSKRPLCRLAKAELDTLSTFPEDWREQARSSGADPDSFFFYDSDG